MKSVTKFNALHGAVVSRDEIVQLLQTAKEEEQTHIENALERVLSSYPNEQKFNWENPNKAISIAPKSILHGLDHETQEPDNYGLNKAVTPEQIYSMITEMMINTIKEVGHLPWQKGWTGTGDVGAMNYVTEKPYSGINYFLLNFPSVIVNGKRVFAPLESKSPYYLTFNQIEKLGARLKKGSKGHEVVYYNFINTYKDENHSFTTTDATKLESFVKKNNISKEQIERHLKRYPILKYYIVFKADDCDGLKPKEPKTPKRSPIAIAESIINNYPGKPKYEFGTDKAFYSPLLDYVSMPKIAAFKSEVEYYTTFFHEIVHSTGHPKRLGRDMSGRFGNEKYAFEELVAELGAVYLSSEAGILFHTRSNSAKYLKGWNSKLVKKMEDDNRFFFKAAAEAQKAVNLILGDRKHLEITETEKVVKPNPVPAVKKEKKAVDKTKNNSPVSFANKPKSVSVATAINDVLTLPKYKGIVKPLVANLLFKIFKEDTAAIIDLQTDYEIGILKKDSPLHTSYLGDELELTSLGVDFINSVNGRIESLKNQKHNFALFDGLKATAKGNDAIFFNKEVIKAKRSGRFASAKIFNLGKTQNVLLEKLGSYNITVSGATLNKSMTKDSDHAATFEHFINLPDTLNDPVAIFKSSSEPKAVVILTTLKTHKEKPLIAAIHLNKSFKISKIASIYSKTNSAIFNKWENDGLCLYKNKKSFDALLSGLIPVSQSVKGQNKGINKNQSTKKKPLNGLIDGLLVNMVANAATSGLGTPESNTLASSLQNRQNATHEYYNIPDKEISAFLGKIEKKQKESVAITIAAPQGAMKTRFCFRLMNALAQNYKVGHASIEEHPESVLYFDKAKEYCNQKALHNISAPEINTIEDVHKLVKQNDVVVIDSFSKLQEMDKNCQLDKDFRKAYDGKLFIIIYQLTSDGKMRGGSKSQFDADCIAYIEKKPNYQDNYVWWDKNRYQDKPELKYNIFSGKLQKDAEEIKQESQSSKKPNFSFSIV